MDRDKKILQQAKKIFRDMVLDTIQLTPSPILVDPIPIFNPEIGEIVSWMVGVKSDELLCGYIQLDENLEFMRYASFQRDPTSLKGCPSTNSWLNPDVIKEKAQNFAKDASILEDPYLSYDNNITRLCWIVPVEDKKGKKYDIMLAGDYIYTK